MRSLSLVFLCFFLSACDGNTRDRRAARGEDYVSDPDHLFFLNTRSRDYRAVGLEEGVDAYRHDELTESDHLLIIDRWIEDRAQLVARDAVLSVSQVLTLRDSLRRQDRSAALEVVEDYLRLVGE
ncbi:hypothetical protein GGR28_002679 [Lewinella aquimaris]|uniref:Uncharacterized protein n=1 Tax=Neolewinella aquimaris TaxID=1835722 RepID=A0A840EE26_9BACT|nr:hypothetical protein [Neolewinella aquimaris]MBB4080049.1 hypothetical protein [Neolewinella aquimaris]